VAQQQRQHPGSRTHGCSGCNHASIHSADDACADICATPGCADLFTAASAGVTVLAANCALIPITQFRGITVQTIDTATGCTICITATSLR
jgi:hypothetical protein